MVSQITLFKGFANNSLKIDLHWNLSFIKDQLPNIEDIFNNKEFTIFNNIYIPTLNKQNALIHTCIHNGIDGWNNIRGIIDFYRLFEINNEIDIQKFRCNNSFINNCAYCYQLFEEPKLKKFLSLNFKNKLERKFKNKIKNNSLLTIRLISNKDWSLKKRILLLIRHLKLTNNPEEIIKIILNHFFPPKDLWCNEKQRFYYLYEIIFMRFRKIFIRMFMKKS